jgi:hypothetical protein
VSLPPQKVDFAKSAMDVAMLRNDPSQRFDNGTKLTGSKSETLTDFTQESGHA